MRPEGRRVPLAALLVLGIAPGFGRRLSASEGRQLRAAMPRLASLYPLLIDIGFNVIDPAIGYVR